MDRDANFSLWLKKQARGVVILGTLSAQKALPRVQDQKKEFQELLEGKKNKAGTSEIFH